MAYGKKMAGGRSGAVGDGTAGQHSGRGRGGRRATDQAVRQRTTRTTVREETAGTGGCVVVEAGGAHEDA